MADARSYPATPHIEEDARPIETDVNPYSESPHGTLNIVVSSVDNVPRVPNESQMHLHPQSPYGTRDTGDTGESSLGVHSISHYAQILNSDIVMSLNSKPEASSPSQPVTEDLVPENQPRFIHVAQDKRNTLTQNTAADSTSAHIRQSAISNVPNSQ